MNVCRNRRFFTVAAAAVLGVLVLAAPQAAKQGFASGTALCLDSVLPALFPFFVVCELLMAAPPPAVLLRPLQRVLGLESAEAAQAVVLSWVGGYAVCARLAGQLYGAGKISRRDAVRLQILGCCSGPGFVIGCVGGLLLGNVRLGVVLYAAQIGANLMVAGVLAYLPLRGSWSEGPEGESLAIARKVLGSGKALSPSRCGGSPLAEGAKSSPVTFPSAITSAVTSSLSVCGCVVFFRLVGAVLGAVIPLPSVLVSAALEVSAGCADFAVLGGQAALYGCCAVLSLLGVSVWAQMQLFAGAAFCPQVLLASRLLHLVFLQGILRFCVQFLPGDVGVCSTLSARIVPLLHLPPDAAAVGFVFLCAALYKAWQNLYNK